MVAALERHPTVRLSLHYTGPLLEWLRRERPDFIERLRGARRPRPDRDPRRRLSTSRSSPRCRSGTASASSAGWATSSSDVRAAPQRRVAGRARLGAGPADLARRRRLRLDDPRRRPFPGGGDPGGGALGSVHDRGPGPACCGSSGPSRACATASRSATVDEVIAYLRDHATEAGDRIGMMGDDGEKFGAWPSTWEHCWGDGPLGRAVLRGARGQRRLADDDHAVGLAGRPPPDRSGLRPDRLLRGDGRVGAAARREPALHATSSTAPRPRAGPRRAGCAGRSGATSRSSTARSTTCTSRCCGPPDAVDGDARGPRPGARARPPLSGPVERLLLARAVRRASTSATCGSRRTSTSSRPRTWPTTAAGRLRGAERHRPRPRRHRRRPPGGAGPGRHDRPGRGRRHRRLGHPAGPARAGRRHASAARGLPRRPCAATRPRWPPACRAERDRGRRSTTRTPSRPRSTTSCGRRSRACDRYLQYDPYERRSGLVRFLARSTRRRRLGPRAEAIGARRRRRRRLRLVDAR